MITSIRLQTIRKLQFELTHSHCHYNVLLVSAKYQKIASQGELVKVNEIILSRARFYIVFFVIMHQWMKQYRARKLQKGVHFIPGILLRKGTQRFAPNRVIEFLQKIPCVNIQDELVELLCRSNSRFESLKVTLKLIIHGIRAKECITGRPMDLRSCGDCIPELVLAGL